MGSRIAFWFLVLAAIRVRTGTILDDFAVLVHANAVDDGFAVRNFLRFRLRGLALGSDEAAFDAGRSVMVEHHEKAAPVHVVGIIGMTTRVDAPDFFLKPLQALFHFGGSSSAPSHFSDRAAYFSRAAV